MKAKKQWILWLVVGACLVAADLALLATDRTIRIQKWGLVEPSSCAFNANINSLLSAK